MKQKKEKPNVQKRRRQSFLGEKMDKLIEGIKFAISLEDKGLKFYTKILESAKRDEVVVLFKFLVTAETAHKKALELCLKVLRTKIWYL